MEAQLADGSVWLAQHEIARLFGGFSATVCNNLRAISKSGVLFEKHVSRRFPAGTKYSDCPLYTSDAADERTSVDLGGRRIIKKKKDTI